MYSVSHKAMETMEMKVIFRQKGHTDLEVEVFTLPALKHITEVMIKWCEENMPEWAEIIYQFVDKIY